MAKRLAAKGKRTLDLSKKAVYSSILQSSFLSHHTTDIGIAFSTPVKLWLALSWVDSTINMAWYRRLHEFLRITSQFKR